MRKRAPFDLECDGPLQLQEIAQNTWGVRGCGKKASYSCIDGADDEDPYYNFTCSLDAVSEEQASE